MLSSPGEFKVTWDLFDLLDENRMKMLHGGGALWGTIFGAKLSHIHMGEGLYIILLTKTFLYIRILHACTYFSIILVRGNLQGGAGVFGDIIQI